VKGYPLPGNPAVGPDARLWAPTHPHRDGSDGVRVPSRGRVWRRGRCVCKVPGTTPLLDVGGAANRVRVSGVPSRASESACRDFDASARSARKLRRRTFARSSASRRPSRSSRGAANGCLSRWGAAGTRASFHSGNFVATRHAPAGRPRKRQASPSRGGAPAHPPPGRGYRSASYPVQGSHFRLQAHSKQHTRLHSVHSFMRTHTHVPARRTYARAQSHTCVRECTLHGT